MRGTVVHAAHVASGERTAHTGLGVQSPDGVLGLDRDVEHAVQLARASQRNASAPGERHVLHSARHVHVN
eukprot:1181931-Prorocentrum_minimum.AAC.5